MPREGNLIFCDRCGIMLAPAGRKPQPGERAAGLLTDDKMLCDRHAAATPTPTPATEPAPAPSPAPAAPKPEPVDPAQAALDALPSWIKEDGARHGRIRLELATAEAHDTPAPRHPAPAAASPTPAPVPAPAARDTKDTPKADRPVRRPARPRREPSPTALAAVAPAADTHDMSALDRMHDAKGGAPAPRPWVSEMPGPARPAAPAARPTPRPAVTAAEAARTRRELALAYARKHGDLMAPPSRRPIVTAEEITKGMQAARARGTGAFRASFHPDDELSVEGAAQYLGTTPSEFKKLVRARRGPQHHGTTDRYLVADLDLFLTEGPRTKTRKSRQASTTRRKPATQAPRRKNVAKPEWPTARVAWEKAHARLDTIVRLVDGGAAFDAALTEVGVSRHSLIQAARRYGREDVLARVPGYRSRGAQECAA